MPDERDISIWLIIPAYNEAAVMARVVTDVVRRGYNVAVIDDGSTDETGRKAAAAGAIVITRSISAKARRYRPASNSLCAKLPIPS